MGSNSPSFIIEFIFHRATHVPIGDLNTLSCDPYILASLEIPNVHPDYPQPPLQYRTQTIRRSLHPTYNARWIVGGIPERGFTLTLGLMDEDPGDNDDRLGKVTIRIPDPFSKNQKLDEGLNTGEVEYKVEKRRGSIRAYAATYIATMITRGNVSHHARIWASIRVIRKEARYSRDRRIYTIGPPKYTQHFSPLIGHLISSGTAANEPFAKGKNNKPLGASTFVANRLQLAGPPPLSLRHRYVGYAPFIQSLFKKSGIRGKILNYALHRQYHTIYGYGKSTVYGIAGEGEIDTDGSQKRKSQQTTHTATGNGDIGGQAHTESEGGGSEPLTNGAQPEQANLKGQSHSDAISRQFLSMTSHGTAGRIFTYVITLDSEWRFTETGEEFSVDMLSKHSMHADVAKEVAFSGEFFVRRTRDREHRESEIHDKDETRASHTDKEEHAKEAISNDPKDYELVIDNDSGTYRPKKELLPTLQEWLAQDGNLGALGKVTAMDGFNETLKKWKEERQEEKRRAKGLKPHRKKDAVGKGKEADHGEEGHGDDIGKMVMPKKGSSLRSIESGELGSGTAGVSSSDVESIVENEAKRARENDDGDISASHKKGETSGDGT